MFSLCTGTEGVRGASINWAVMVLLAWLMSAPQLGAEGLDLKSMILMPGPLTQAHAEQEQNCDVCHSSFDKSAQDSLCLDCHEDVASDSDLSVGFHGISPMVSKKSCKGCHTDHKGREYNIMPMDQDIFDHQNTDFPLSGKHIEAACESCHADGSRFRETLGTCYDCHREQDQHRSSLGEQCADCHTPDSWQTPKEFDHSSTDFPLLGQHESLHCSSCHAGETYSFDNTECSGCHQLRDVHLGRYGNDCQRCHNEEGWDKPIFDHNVETDFKLTGAHRKSSCQACHSGGMIDSKPSTECASCHRSSDVHGGRHGDNCASCHNTRDWEEADFDHGKEANWPLTGNHEKLTCLQCHQGSLDDSLSPQCSDCHRADDVHKSEKLGDCGVCHQSGGWDKTDQFDHELAQFPLEGMHAIAACQSCHASHEFNAAKSACVDCHRSDDIHEAGLGSQCESCHTPNGWSLWTFDHDTSTDFKLAGAHAGLSCGSCHQGEAASEAPRNCASCHVGDDRHKGSFGDNCGRCHSSDSFGEVQWHR